MNLGLIGDEYLHLVADMTWVQDKFLEILERAKPDWLVTYDLPGASQLRRFVPDVPRTKPDDFTAFVVAPKIAVNRLVLINTYYHPRHCEIALQDANLSLWVDYTVIFSNGQDHHFLNQHRHGKILEVNYLTRKDTWQTYV